MTRIWAALLPIIDDDVRARLKDAKALKDHLIIEGSPNLLIAITEKEADFTGIEPVSMKVTERSHEELVAVFSGPDADFSHAAIRAYADPFFNEDLVLDRLIGDGFIMDTGEVFDSPADNLRILRALDSGESLKSVSRMGGEPSAMLADGLLVARVGEKHVDIDRIIGSLGLEPPAWAGGQGKKAKARIVPFTVNGGKLSYDNTFENGEREVHLL